MSKTWDFLQINKPVIFPFETTVEIEKSVEGMSLRDKQDDKTKLSFVIGPTYIGSPIVRRKIVLSHEKTPELKFKYSEAGEFKINKKKVYILLEN